MDCLVKFCGCRRSLRLYNRPFGSGRAESLALCSEVFSNLVEEDSRMYTSLVLGACLLASPATEVAQTPLSWQSDYAAACRTAKGRQKPLAVFVGRGPEGWQKVSQ